jgi:hypothetical protein
VGYVHKHNLVQPEFAERDEREKRFGVRISLPPGDTFARLLGSNWERTHWYATEQERDKAFERLATRHGYYRKTDDPTQVLERISR